MADALVAFFLQRVNSLLVEETKTFSGVKDQIFLLKTKLSDLQAQIPFFIRKLIEISYFSTGHATQSPEVERLIKNWLVKVREIIYSADDCIDLFIVQFMNSQDEDGSTIVKFRNELRRINQRLDKILDNKYQQELEVKNNMKSASQSSGGGDDNDDDEGEQSMASFVLKYSSLPYYLKSCLWYCCTFRFSFIETEKLVQLLMAEGLIQEIPGERMEDVAHENINKLLDLGMLHVLPRFGDIVVPSRYHKFLLGVAEDENFFVTNASSDYYIPISARHVSIKDIDEKEKSPPNFKILNLPLRSLFIRGIPRKHNSYQNSMFCSLIILRILDLKSINIKNMPEEVGNLIHLRYLGLDECCLVNLPNSISRLQNLQTLSICGMNVLPSGILNLVQLRHLIMDRGPSLFPRLNPYETKVPRGIGGLKDLQTLTGLYAGGGIAKELSNLTQLRKLGVRDLSDDHTSDLCTSIVKMTGLLSLSLVIEKSYSKDSLLPSLEQFSPPPLLQFLHLEGRLTELPDWFSSIQNLTHLSLSFSYLSDLVLPFLPNLKHLTLKEAYKTKLIGREFCGSNGFPSLEVLVIDNKKLVEWTELEVGALPSLKYLCFENCYSLRTLPEGLQLITTLKELKINPLHGDLARKLSPKGGRENYKIKHIPVIWPKF